MTASLNQMRLLQALRLLSVVPVCMLGQFADAVGAQSDTESSDIAAVASVASDGDGTAPVLTADHAAIDLDDVFERAGSSLGGVSGPVTSRGRTFLVRVARGPEGVGSPLLERPPRA